MDSAQHPSLPPEGDSPACPLCRLPLQAREDGDGGQWTHQCLECGHVYRVTTTVNVLRHYDDKRLRPTDTGRAVGGARTEGERE
jgi:uncharacterized protein YbaR (Trm112 family)